MLIGAATLVVYGLTAAAAFALSHRYVRPLRFGTCVLLAALPLLFTGRAMIQGGAYASVDILYADPPLSAHREELGISGVRSPSLGDVVYQHIPWRYAVRRALRHGQVPLWNPNVLAGEPLIGVQQAGVLRPAVWIGMLLPPAASWTFDVTIRLFTALLCAYLFLDDLGCGTAPALLGAAGWAFSDFLVFFLGFSIAPPTAPFPLALLGARRVVRQPDARSGALLTVALAAALAGGHPETAVHTGTAAALYFLFELAGAPRGNRARSCAVGAAASFLALGLCAVVLLPMAEILPVTAEHAFRKSWYALQKRSVPGGESLFRLAPQIVPYGVGVDGVSAIKPGYLVPSSYAGALLLPFAAVGLASRRRERWFFLALGLASLAVCVKTAAADWIAKLPFFDIAINEYMIVLVAFSVCALAALGAQRVSEGRSRAALLTAMAWAAILLALVHEHFRPTMNVLHMPPAYRHARLAEQLAPLLAAGAVTAALGRRRVAKAVAVTTAIFVASRVVEEGRVNPTIRSEAFYPLPAVLARVPRDAPWRIAAVGNRFLPNLSAVYDVEDVRGYSAMTLQALRETDELWCVPQGVWFNRVDDPARPFLSFLNMRWALLPAGAPPPSGWPVIAEAEGLRLVENPGALPRAFVPGRLRGEADRARRLALLGTIPDFRKEGVLSSGPAEWMANGDGTATVEAYAASSLTVRTAATTETVVGTSIPAWPGWRAELDGRSLPLLAFNHAFVGLRVPPGTHRVVLCYAPGGFGRGLAASAGSVLVLGAWLTLDRRRRSPMNAMTSPVRPETAAPATNPGGR